MNTASVAFGASAAVLVGGVLGYAVGVAWARIRPAPQPLVEGVLGLAGVVSTASAVTLLLFHLWTGRWIPRGVGGGVGDPFFVAALLGTLAGHVALIGWARATGGALAVRVPSARWLGVGALSGLAGVGASLAWVEVARSLGLPVIDQDIVTDLLTAPPGPGRAAVLGFVVLGAPVLEELVFRGFLQGVISRSLGAHAAIAVSALAFGAFHLADPPVVPVLVALGALFGWLRHRSGSVIPGILGHIVNNGAAVSLAMWL